MAFINFNFINCFNKKESLNKKGEENFGDSTLNKQKSIMDTNSISVGSITNSQELGKILISNVRNRDNKSIFKEIFIGIISFVLGTVITYFVLGIK